MTAHIPPARILVALDGGGRSDDAVRAVLRLSKLFETHLEFLHAIAIPPPELVAGKPIDTASINAEILTTTWKTQSEALGRILEQEGSEPALAGDHLRVVPGSPAKAIIDRAREAEVDWIALGPHEKHGIFDFGSTTRAVLAETPCDVWVQPRPFESITKILAPVDLSEDSLRALAAARDLAGLLGAEVTALHCFLPPDFAYAPTPGYPVGPTYVIDDLRESSKAEFERVISDFEWGDVKCEARFVEGRPTEMIQEVGSEYDLLVMGSHGRTGLSAAVLGNVAYGVLKRSITPVLVIRHRTREYLLS